MLDEMTMTKGQTTPPRKEPTPDILNLSKASLEELLEHKAKLEKLMERRLQAKKQEALDQIKRLALEHELSFEEVVATIRTATKRGKAPAIYRNPAKPRQTWSGNGEAPQWFLDYPEDRREKDLRIPGA